MREIKFRALLKNKESGKTWWEFYGTISCPAWSDISSWEIIIKDLQFTGLKDKTGREIYEGDILSLNPYKVLAVIEYLESSFVFHFNKEPDDYWVPNNMATTMRAEVIGNIYENPELLK